MSTYRGHALPPETETAYLKFRIKELSDCLRQSAMMLHSRHNNGSRDPISWVDCTRVMCRQNLKVLTGANSTAWLDNELGLNHE